MKLTHENMKTLNYKGFVIETEGAASLIYQNGNLRGGTCSDYTTVDFSKKDYIATPIFNSEDKAKVKIDSNNFLIK